MNKVKFTQNLIKGGLFTLAIALLGTFANAQSYISTPLQLKQLCETSPNNTILLSQSIKIEQNPLLVTVNTGCTIIVPQDMAFEMDKSSMNFNGVFTVNGNFKTKVALQEALLQANAINLNLVGAESMLFVDEAGVRTTAGNLNINFGGGGKVEMVEASRRGSLSSAGSLNITSGGGFNAVLFDSPLTAGNSINIAFNGFEANFKTGGNSNILANGAINITASDSKASIEMEGGRIEGGNGVNIALAGTENGLGMKFTSINGGAGNVSLRSGTLANANKGSIKLSEVTARSAGSLNVLSSLNGTEGGIGVEKSNFTFGGDIHLVSGNMGKSEVFVTQMTSNTRARVATGVGGVCVASLNTVNAPINQVCQ